MKRYKKHYYHMNEAEIATVKTIVKKRLQNMSTLTHFHDMVEKRIDLTYTEILEIFYNGDFNLIECHNAYDNNCGSFRAVIRSHQIVKERNIIIVVDVFKQQVVTMYTNHHEDTHSTLDESKYFNTDVKLDKMYRRCL